jgi:hypothetical protein
MSTAREDYARRKDQLRRLREEANSRIFARADQMFPELGLESYRGGWRGSKKLYGDEPQVKRKDKTVITSNVPFRILSRAASQFHFTITYPPEIV